MTTKSLTLDIWQKNHAIVKANQGEVNSRFLEITLTDKSVPLDLTGKTVIFYATKPNRHVIYNLCEIENVKSGIISVCLTSQMSAVAGKMPCEVHIIDNEKSILKAVGLELEIVKCADLEDAVESKSEFTALEKAMAEYESASEKFNFHLDSRSNPHEVTTAQIGAVPVARTINSKTLNSDIELTPEDVGSAAAEHTHVASDITSGTLPVERGGTGANEIYTAQSNLGLMKRYTNLNHLTLGESYTIKDIFLAMKNNSYIEMWVGSNSSDAIRAACPVNAGTLRIYRLANQYEGYAEFNGSPIVGNARWFSSIHADRLFVWNKVYTSNQTVPIKSGGTGATTASAALSNLGAVPATRTINSKPLNSDIELNCDNIGAAAADHNHDADEITSGVLSIERGGTGAKTATEAQSALKIFTDISQLNLAYPCTTGDIINAMPAGSIGFFYVEASLSTVTDVATGFSFLEIYKATPNRVRVLLNGSPSDGSSTGSTFNIGQYNAATHTIESWKRIQTSAFATPINCGGTGATTYKDAQKNFHFYTDLAQLGITAPCTTADVVNALPISSIFLLGTESVSASITDAPTGYGFFAIFKGANPNRKMGFFARSLTNTENYEAGNWFYIMNVANGAYSWQKILTNVSTDNSLLTNSKTIVSAINELYNTTELISIKSGGTGATTASAALSNLGAVPVARTINSKALNSNIELTPEDVGAAAAEHTHTASDISSGALSIENGGTGATTASAALSNLGAVPQTRTINSKDLSYDIELNCADVGAAEENHVHDFSELINTPTTLAGYGITDVLSNEHTHTFNSIEEKPTTIDGYGITDAVMQSRMINSKPLSSNIELNCTDIGAAPYEAKSSADFNEMKTPGLYTMRSSTANAPTSESYHSLIVNKSDTGNYVQQIAIKESSYDIYIRYLSGSSWSNWIKIKTDKDEINIDKVYPVGSIYMSVNSTNPSNYFGGTWVSWGQGQVPVGVNISDSNFSTVEKTGGEKSHILTSSEMPKHAHYTGIYTGNGSTSHFAATGGDSLYSNTDTGQTGGSQAHNNLQPYITCYMWKRTV